MNQNPIQSNTDPQLSPPHTHTHNNSYPTVFLIMFYIFTTFFFTIHNLINIPYPKISIFFSFSGDLTEDDDNIVDGWIESLNENRNIPSYPNTPQISI